MVKDPRILEKKLLKDLDIFVHRVEHAIFELQQNPDIRLLSIDFGKPDPFNSGRLLDVRATGKVNNIDKLMGFRKIIADR